MIDTVLNKSGKSGVFCDRLAKDRASDRWVAWEALGNHDPVSFLAANLNAAKENAIELKVACVPLLWRAGGGNCLGLRLNHKPSSTVVTWRAKSIPFPWAETDLFDVLQEAGWAELSVIAYPTRKIRPWLLRGKAPATVDHVASIRHEAGE